MLRLYPLLFLVVLTLAGCRTDTAPNPTNPAPAAPQTERRLAPDELFGELFRRVQMERIFADGKTFVDMVPKRSAAEIMADYETAKAAAGFDLKTYVEQNFDPPRQPKSGFASDGDQPLLVHIDTLWPVLTRPAGSEEGSAGSLIPLPNQYVVPGGRFREVYYWDSYFTMLGLRVSGKGELIRDMVENFAYLIDEVGHIPNGNRTYYLTRSQPPFFAFMVELLAEMEGEEGYTEFLPQLIAEYNFWMDGVDDVTETAPASGHVVRMPDGSLLNRYYDAGDRPRAESYREDVLTIRESGRDSQTVARHLRSGAESGWDYSARWFLDGEHLHTIATTDIIPPDLNALLYKLESILQQHGGEDYAGVADRRKAAINKWLYDDEVGFYQDIFWRGGGAAGAELVVNDTPKYTGYLTLAGVYPLFVGLADNRQAAAVGDLIAEQFLAPGGVRTSLKITGQQWDNPNGWAPLQWMTYQGLRNYNEGSTAEQIRRRWMANTERVYENVHKLVEKYNVEDITLLAGGGEYPVQDGFGWSNGVYLALLTAAGRQ